MEDVQMQGIGFTPEDIPALSFDVLLKDGQDYDGKFKIRFALIEHNNKKKLVINGENKYNILGVVPERDSIRVINSLLDKEAYYVFINYHNTEYEVMDGVVEVPILGRMIGEDFDWVEKTETPPEYNTILTQMKQALLKDI